MCRLWDWSAHTGSINVSIFSIHHFQFSDMSKEWQFDFEGVTQKWCSQLLVMNKLDKQKLYKNAKATMNVIKMDGRGRSKPPTNLYSTRPPQNIFPTHTVNYLPHSHWELPLAPNLRLNHNSSPLTNLHHTHQQSLKALCWARQKKLLPMKGAMMTFPCTISLLTISLMIWNMDCLL